MKLFEIEVYKSWAAVELQQEREVEEAEITMEKAEDYLDLRSWKMPSMSSEGLRMSGWQHPFWSLIGVDFKYFLKIGWGIVAKFLRATPPTLEEETVRIEKEEYGGQVHGKSSNFDF